MSFSLNEQARFQEHKLREQEMWVSNNGHSWWSQGL